MANDTGPDGGTHTGRVVGVAVLSWPSALNRTRHRVFGLRPMRFGDRLRWVNANVRTVSRVIVHPQFRSLGLSTRLIRAAVVACPTRYVEASARMGRAHPMFEHAGFTRADPLTDAEPLYFWLDRTPTFAAATAASCSLSRVPTGEGTGGRSHPRLCFDSPARLSPQGARPCLPPTSPPP